MRLIFPADLPCNFLCLLLHLASCVYVSSQNLNVIGEMNRYNISYYVKLKF